MISLIKDDLARRFGGYSSESLEGGYLLGNRIMKGPVERIYSYYSDEGDFVSYIRELAEWVKNVLDQHSVLLEVDGDAYLI